MRKLFLGALLPLVAVCCTSAPALFDQEAFRASVNGKEVGLFTLQSSDITLQLTNYGARVVSLWTPDVKGRMENIVVGHDHIDDYLTPPGERFLGATVGPVANRIGNASFTLDGITYQLSANDHEKNTLHGGFTGVDHLVWDVAEVCDTAIVLTVELRDGQEGFPGNRQVRLQYSLSGQDFKVEITALTDKPTPVSFTHHPFFCLRGQGVDTVEPYWLWLPASHYIPIDELSIPTGEVASVEGTPFDFREPHPIGERIGEENEQLLNAKGYDHNWCLDGTGTVERACRLWDPQSGRCVEVLTDQPGLQVYTGNFFDGSETGSNGRRLGFRSSIALEAQNWPDAVNQPSFPSCILLPGETYSNITIYRFTASSSIQ